jgi:hypothetical protein
MKSLPCAAQIQLSREKKKGKEKEHNTTPSPKNERRKGHHVFLNPRHNILASSKGKRLRRQSWQEQLRSVQRRKLFIRAKVENARKVQANLI